jgi:hypothetical protein
MISPVARGNLPQSGYVRQPKHPNTPPERGHFGKNPADLVTSRFGIGSSGNDSEPLNWSSLKSSFAEKDYNLAKSMLLVIQGRKSSVGNPNNTNASDMDVFVAICILSKLAQQPAGEAQKQSSSSSPAQNLSSNAVTVTNDKGYELKFSLNGKVLFTIHDKPFYLTVSQVMTCDGSSGTLTLPVDVSYASSPTATPTDTLTNSSSAPAVVSGVTNATAPGSSANPSSAIPDDDKVKWGATHKTLLSAKLSIPGGSSTGSLEWLQKNYRHQEAKIKQGGAFIHSNTSESIHSQINKLTSSHNVNISNDFVDLTEIDRNTQNELFFLASCLYHGYGGARDAAKAIKIFTFLAGKFVESESSAVQVGSKTFRQSVGIEALDILFEHNWNDNKKEEAFKYAIQVAYYGIKHKNYTFAGKGMNNVAVILKDNADFVSKLFPEDKKKYNAVLKYAGVKSDTQPDTQNNVIRMALYKKASKDRPVAANNYLVLALGTGKTIENMTSVFYRPIFAPNPVDQVTKQQSPEGSYLIANQYKTLASNTHNNTAKFKTYIISQAYYLHLAALNGHSVAFNELVTLLASHPEMFNKLANQIANANVSVGSETLDSNGSPGEELKAVEPKNVRQAKAVVLDIGGSPGEELQALESEEVKDAWNLLVSPIINDQTIISSAGIPKDTPGTTENSGAPATAVDTATPVVTDTGKTAVVVGATVPGASAGESTTITTTPIAEDNVGNNGGEGSSGRNIDSTASTAVFVAPIPIHDSGVTPPVNLNDKNDLKRVGQANAQRNKEYPVVNISAAGNQGLGELMPQEHLVSIALIVVLVMVPPLELIF